MTGIDFMTSKRDAHKQALAAAQQLENDAQAVVAQHQAVVLAEQNKINSANTGIDLLNRPSIMQAEAQRLLEIYQELQ